MAGKWARPPFQNVYGGSFGAYFLGPDFGTTRNAFFMAETPTKNHWCGHFHDRHYPWFGIHSTGTITISYPDTVTLAQAQLLKSGSPVTLMGAASAMVRWRPRLQYQDWWRQPLRQQQHYYLYWYLYWHLYWYSYCYLYWYVF